MNKTEKQKMLAGELYRPDDELGAEQAAAKAWMVRYNAALASPVSERHALLRERLGRVGKDAVIRPPFLCDYGYNIRLGDGVFLNFNCVILDVVEVVIGDRTQIGPAVQIYAADHPRDAETRRPASNSAARCGSAATSGSAAAPSSCPASRSAMAPSSAPAASSRGTSARASPLPETRPGRVRPDACLRARAFAISPPPAMESPHVCAAHHRH